MPNKNVIKILRNRLLAGAIVIIPIWITILLISGLVDVINKSFSLLPAALQPRTYISFPGIEIIISLILILLIGIIANNFLGKKVLAAGESILSKIPIFKTVYQGIKHLTEGIISDKKVFTRVVLLEFPIKGLKFIGFVTGEEKTLRSPDQSKMLRIFIPTTPNPTTGFFCFAEEKNVTDLDLTVDEAFKLIISAGYAEISKPLEKKTTL